MVHSILLINIYHSFIHILIPFWSSYLFILLLSLYCPLVCYGLFPWLISIFSCSSIAYIMFAISNLFKILNYDSIPLIHQFKCVSDVINNYEIILKIFHLYYVIKLYIDYMYHFFCVILFMLGFIYYITLFYFGSIHFLSFLVTYCFNLIMLYFSYYHS